jgi:hypothetical protein
MTKFFTYVKRVHLIFAYAIIFSKGKITVKQVSKVYILGVTDKIKIPMDTKDLTLSLEALGPIKPTIFEG